MQISSIKWSYDTPKVAGTAWLEHTMVPFEYDSDVLSEFEITNNLWALLEANV